MSKIELPPLIISNFVAITLYKNYKKENPEDEDDYAAGQWSIRKGYPRFTVGLHNSKSFKEKQKKEGKDWSKVITAPLDIVNMSTFISDMYVVLKSKDPIAKKVYLYNKKYVDNKPTDETYLQATLIFGRDDKDFIYLSAIAKDKPKIKFLLVPRDTQYVRFDNLDPMEETNLRIVNHRYAKAYVKLLDKFMTEYGVAENVNTFDVNALPRESSPSKQQTSSTTKDKSSFSSSDELIDEMLG